MGRGMDMIKQDFQDEAELTPKERAAFSAGFCAALDKNTAYIYIVDPLGYEIIYCNQACRDYLGQPPEGKLCYRDFLGWEEPCLKCPVREWLQGRPAPAEVQTRRGDWLLCQVSPLRWQGREMMMVSCIDISSQKRAEEELQLRSQEYGVVVAQSGKYVMRYDLRTHTAIGDDATADLFGGRTDLFDDPRRSVDSGLVARESAADFLRFYQHMHQGAPQGQCDIRLRRAENDYRWFHLDYARITAGDGRPGRAVISFFDVTGLRQKELDYQKWRAAVDRLIAQSRKYLDIDLSAGLIEREVGDPWYCSCPQEGYSYDQALDLAQATLPYGEDRAAFGDFFCRSRVLQLFAAGVDNDQIEYRVRRENGEIGWLRAVLQMTKDPYNDNVRAFIICSDMDDLQGELERLSHAARQDSMTGLLNRGAAQERIGRLLSLAPLGESFAFFLLDLDNFKQVNDLLGHEQGDEVLIRSARLLRDSFRTSDVVARIGGDEFIAFLPLSGGIGPAHAKAAALVETMQFVVNGVMLSASVGVAVAQAGRADFGSLYRQADQALYQAKRKGKNRFAVLGENGDSAAGQD